MSDLDGAETWTLAVWATAAELWNREKERNNSNKTIPICMFEIRNLPALANISEAQRG